MSEPTKDELLGQLAQARADADAAVMCLIYLELGEVLTALDAREDQAAAALREASDALTAPQAAVDAIAAEIVKAEGRAAEWLAKLDPDKPADERAQARIHFAEWDADITRLCQKRDWAEAEMQPLVERRDHARKVLADLQAAKQGVIRAQLNPFGSPVAQATQAYIGYRMPYLNLILIANDRESPEWETAIAELEECCLRSAYRTDHLIGHAEQQARAMTSAMADVSTSPPPPAPSAVELGKQLEVEMENRRLANTPVHIEDYRHPVPQRPPVQKRAFMEVPRLRNMLR